MEGIWGFVIIAGPIILLAALVAGWLMNRKSRVPESVTEAGTRERKLEENAEEREHPLR